jgi:hypothetical protein
MNAATSPTTKRTRAAWDWKAMAVKATDVIRKHQRADYEFLKKELGTNSIGNLTDLLKMLRKKGVVGQGKQRRWVVLQNADGTRKPPEETPLPRRFKKLKRKKTRKASVAAVTPIASIAAAEVTSKEKLALLSELISMSSGRSTVVLTAIAADVESATEAGKLMSLLKS